MALNGKRTKIYGSGAQEYTDRSQANIVDSHSAGEPAGKSSSGPSSREYGSGSNRRNTNQEYKA